ncbi:GNAT family N-acetyltransferase [Bifidobacterium gallicum]|uniref:N-acetyltransferase domain-containing protein n=1 Tax=Bifidobacterium gallicum DSM 20093 = LMG 11596 TaxID=561180 RepID=D1NSI9_9BIFI|nr:hypothetical protein [Bifidobacterium gallicum]EFA23641.1 hypothetical protein BIFGAL_02746 [Bifidobacterium gallicum DSM 20093 = LMG 11596]KFI58702.1 hypothetical protein BGLCM_0995 [Bifidobacterium gallicum DSM 20093 = LMG 11596]
MNIYQTVPVRATTDVTLRLVSPDDAEYLTTVYSDPQAVALMNDDNCDFGFYMPSRQQMETTIAYWLDHYRQRNFVRFTVVSNVTAHAVGTIEGFGGDTGVLRIDLAPAWEQPDIIGQLLDYAVSTFRSYFGNVRLVTKARPGASARRLALRDHGWTSIGAYRGYADYYAISLER